MIAKWYVEEMIRLYIGPILVVLCHSFVYKINARHPASSSSSSRVVVESQLSAHPVTHDDTKDSHKTILKQSWNDAVSDCYTFLFQNIMPLDILNAASLGFHSDSKELHKKITTITDTVQIKRYVSSLPDGLSNGIVNTTIHMALDTKIRYPWTNPIPRHIFMEYVLPYCVVNEARTHWRPLVYDAIQPTLQRLVDDNSSNSSSTIEQVVREINKDLWTALGKPSLFYNNQGEVTIRKDPIVFKAGQTPLIYDPMSILQYGYGSCTGLSILLVDALRCAGIPARLVGTPAWNNNVEKGNHNWIEVYSVTKNSWVFMEPAYGDYGTDQADHMDKNPCERWFCNKEMFQGTKVYAARYDRIKSDGEYYLMAWDIDNTSVPGLDRTQYYLDICSQC